MSQFPPEDETAPRRAHSAGGNGTAGRQARRPTRLVLLRVAVLTVIVAAIGVVVFLPVKFPSVVNSYATIAPVNRWVLAKATDGQLIASTFNYRSGLSEGFRVSTFNPGSSTYFSLSTSLVPGQAITMGDTVGSIYSTEVAERLIALNGQLAAARSLLAVNATGQKSAIVNEAQQRLQFAKRRRDEHLKVEERTQRLFDQHLIPQGEYDRVQSEANALQDEITLTEANLEAARTGAKPEQLNLVSANIAALESEIEAVKGRAATYTLTAPISGTVFPTFSADTLLTIAATDYVALVPVRWSDYRRVAATHHALLTLTGLSQRVAGKVIAMNREIHVLHGEEVVIATASLEAPPADVMPGMLVRCRIHCASVTAVEYGRQFLLSATGSHSLLGGF